ncbi:MAG: sugar-binding protein, partial [Candidatus Ratteibacteria bacterium]
MNFYLYILLLIFSCNLFSEIKMEQEKELLKVKNGKLEIVFNLNSSYGTANIRIGNKNLCDVVPGFVKLYPTEEKGKYKTVNYWIPTGVQKLQYFIKRNEKKIELVVLRNFDDFYVRDYFIVEEEKPYITYITESEKRKTSFSFEYSLYFNLKDSNQIIWRNNSITPENLGGYWDKFIEVKDSRWICGYNKGKYGIIIIRDYNFDPDPAWHHYRLFGGPCLGIKIAQRDFLTRRQFRIIPFENLSPEDIIKNIDLGDTFPSTYSFSNEKKIYPVFFKEGDIKIDGEIEEDVWRDLRKETNFYKFDWNKTNPYLSSQQTEFSAFYDKENIYFSVKCYEENIKNLRTEQKTGGHVWNDDCIEIFVQPCGTDYFQFVVNPLGEKYDNKGLVERWKAKGKIFDNFWQVEVSIPFSMFGRYPKDGEIWGFNICRERRPEEELSSWNETSGGGGFHQINKFGQLIFSPKLTPVKITVFEAKETIGIISEIVNFDEKISEQLRISISIPDNKGIEKIYQIDLNKNEKEIISFFQKGYIEKGYNLSFDITSKTGIPFYTNIFEKTGYTGLVSKLWPLSYGNKLYLKQDTYHTFIFLFGNYTPNPKKFSLILEVPKEIQLLFLDRNYNFSYGQFFPLEEVKQEILTKDNLDFVRYKLKFSKEISPGKLPSQDEERNYERIILPFYFGKTDLKSFNIYFHLESGDGKIKEKENIYNVDVIPAFKAKLPKKIETGVFEWWFGVIQDSVKDKDKKEAAIKTASSFKDAGLNLIVYRAYNKEIKEALNKEGIRVRPSFWWFWWDNEWLKENPDDYAVNFEGKKAKYGEIATVCPMVLIENENAFENTKKLVQKLVTENGNDIWHNTEGPYSWDVCFCDRCIREFKKRYNIPEDEK